jgi:cell division protein ZapD
MPASGRAPGAGFGHRALILYEYPLNERIRTLLRLEALCARFDHFAAQPEAPAHHAALATLFEILEVTSRADLKSDLLQEMERQRQTLLAFRDNPDVSATALSSVLLAVDIAVHKLSSSPGRVGQHLRDNEWLATIRGRANIAGGTCEFDLPSYHAWLNQPAELRSRDIGGWSEPFRPLRDGLEIVLRMLRESAQRSRVSSQKGSFQQTLGGRSHQMVQVRIEAALGAVPEISANKHMLWIRFMAQGVEQRPRPYEGDVTFELSLCNL